MSCTISWNNLDQKGWNVRFQTISRVPVTQSVEYALAAAKMYGQRPRWGVISIDGTEAGLVQMMEAGIFGNLIHAVIIDCGPLWFDDFGKAAHVEAFWREINRQFPRRLGRKRRFIPQCDDGEKIRTALQGVGLVHQAGSAYGTIWLNLTRSLENLRAGLKKNWRGALNKAERADIAVEWDDTGAYLPWFLKIYALDKATRQYSGASAKFLQYLGHSFAVKHGMLIGRVLDVDGQAIAGVMILLHGRSATYQASWCGDAGRTIGAHNLLLWQALEQLKQRGITGLDLGGINEDSAQGVKTFKEGLLGKDNGETVSLSGIYA